ncbi:MAG: LysM peptidoglycan-binding domain-containing protein [Sandaracinaceae bacterium]
MGDFRKMSALLATLGVCLGCGDPPPPPEPVEPPEAAPVAEEEPEAPEEELPPPGIDHTIAEGQTLWEIARAYHVSVNAIMEANRMRPRDLRRLRAGQTVRIPGAEEVLEVVDAPEEPEELPPVEDGAYHRLAEGETLWDVARRYDVPLAAITDRNELDDDAVRLLRPGRAIVIPGVTARQVARATAARDAESGNDGSGSGARGFRHTVTSGETVWDLAGAFGVTVSELMAANGLDEAGVRNLREGARIWIPGVQRDQGGRVRRTLTGRQRTAAIFAARLGLGTLDAARQLLRGRVERRWIAAATRRGRRDRAPGTLLWPVTRGWYVRGYGSGEGGYHLATDIMGRIGWNVRAAAAGIVGYSGDQVPGYGNLVMIVHPGGWVTMYAHNSANSVVAGERVPRGGIIGEVGSTGISRGPHVHFEFMHDGRNCDPIALWRPGVRHRTGRRSRVTPVSWTRTDDRPEEVRCDRRRRHPRSRWVTHETFDDNGG